MLKVEDCIEKTYLAHQLLLLLIPSNQNEKDEIKAQTDSLKASLLESQCTIGQHQRLTICRCFRIS